MQVATVDTRNLIVALVMPSGMFWNWTGQAWESPFNMAKHTRPLTGLANAATADPTGVFANLKIVNIGVELLSKVNAVAAILSVSSPTDTNPVLVDVWIMPSVIMPCSGSLLM